MPMQGGKARQGIRKVVILVVVVVVVGVTRWGVPVLAGKRRL